METGIIIGVAVAAVVIGFLLGSFLSKKSQTKIIEESNKKADLSIQEAKVTSKRIISDAETKANKIMSTADSKHDSIKQRKIQEAKEKFANLRNNFESDKSNHLVQMKEREMTVKALEKELRQKQDGFQNEVDAIQHREAEVKTIRENLDKQLKIVSKRKEELDQSNERIIRQLENIAKMSEDQAKESLLEAVKAKAETDALSLEKSILEQAKLTANKEAKKVVIQTIQRHCSEFTIENTVSVFNLESDDIKGQIIGREGRNIRALEAATGAELVVDDTPEAIVISSFDPIRREICRLSLQRLVADGRIHPDCY